MVRHPTELGKKCRSLQFLLIFCNFICFVMSLLVMSGFLYMYSHMKKYKEFINDDIYYQTPVLICLPFGLNVIITFLGWYGAKEENWKMLIGYCAALIFIIICLAASKTYCIFLLEVHLNQN